MSRGCFPPPQAPFLDLRAVSSRALIWTSFCMCVSMPCSPPGRLSVLLDLSDILTRTAVTPSPHEALVSGTQSKVRGVQRVEGDTVQPPGSLWKSRDKYFPVHLPVTKGKEWTQVTSVIMVTPSLPSVVASQLPCGPGWPCLLLPKTDGFPLTT